MELALDKMLGYGQGITKVLAIPDSVFLTAMWARYVAAVDLVVESKLSSLPSGLRANILGNAMGGGL